ncbi:AbrB/MazE/SpoVT family DNA-binding domain-containing protein [Candidatus Gottesmanbacteria bacterium]|nr:AbrB/MazE/SpoVT family DNA-binding domain-containing protein [Candidatus Gottesmanbacteria bacterium]
MAQKVIKTGNSLAVVIPSKITKVMGIKRGDSVKIKSISERANIILSFPKLMQLPLSLGRIQKKH